MLSQSVNRYTAKTLRTGKNRKKFEKKLLLSNKEDTLKMKVADLLELLGLYRRVTSRKRIKLLNEQRRKIKSIEAGRGTITELAEINAASDKASADLIRVRQNIRLEVNELQFYIGEKITKVKTLNRDITNFDLLNKTNSTWEENAVVNNFELKSKKEKLKR